MKISMKRGWFIITCLAWVGGLSPFSLQAQEELAAPQWIERSSLPPLIAPYVPISGTSKATMGAISADIDRFISVHDYSDIKNMNSYFAYVGVDDAGLNIGYAWNMGSLYMGVSYGGSLLNDLFKRITNQPNSDIHSISQSSGDSATDHRLEDASGNPLIGEISSNNNLGILFGIGRNLGIKIGFAESLSGNYELAIIDLDPILGMDEDENPIITRTRITKINKTFGSGLRPSFEVGFKYRAGSVVVKPSIRAAMDIRQSSKNPVEESIKIGKEYADKVEGTIVQSAVTDTSEEILRDYMETSGGLTLGFDFANTEKLRLSFALNGDAYYRMYNYANAQDDNDANILSTWETTNISTTADSSKTDITTITATVDDLRFAVNPVFFFNSKLSDHFSLGFKANVGLGYDYLALNQTVSSTKEPAYESLALETTDKVFTVTPEIAVGLSFKIIPDHIALHAGVGIQLFSYIDEKTEDITKKNKSSTTTTIMPKTKIAGGLTFNFTSATALDVLAVSSGLNKADNTKFTLLFVMKQ
jgi:hypothetical protein